MNAATTSDHKSMKCQHKFRFFYTSFYQAFIVVHQADEIPSELIIHFKTSLTDLLFHFFVSLAWSWTARLENVWTTLECAACDWSRGRLRVKQKMFPASAQTVSRVLRQPMEQNDFKVNMKKAERLWSVQRRRQSFPRHGRENTNRRGLHAFPPFILPL